MQNVFISVLLTVFFVLTDLLPLLRDKNREKKAVWFSIPVYAIALLINVLAGLGIRITSDPVVSAFLDSLIKNPFS